MRKIGVGPIVNEVYEQDLWMLDHNTLYSVSIACMARGGSVPNSFHVLSVGPKSNQVKSNRMDQPKKREKKKKKGKNQS